MSSQPERIPLVDAHPYIPRMSTLKPSWREWTDRFGRPGWREVYDDYGDPVPRRLAAMPDSERAQLFGEYRPRATRIQAIEDLPPIRDNNPARFLLVTNVNPRIHHPSAAEVERQLDFGAVAVKLHPVHGVFSPADPHVRSSIKRAPSAGRR
jgi:predicted TIM-barrel fold metal-dependent hydrolase